MLSIKSAISGNSKSQILRNSIHSFDANEYDPDTIYHLYDERDDLKDGILDMLVSHFRRSGYPHRKISNQELHKEMDRLSRTKNPLLPDNNLQINTVGLSASNYFHHHMVKVRTGRERAPYDQYADDTLLRDAIKRWMEMGKKPNTSGIRKILRTRDGVKSVVNFKPAIAKYFYDKYCPEGGRSLDPCAGYGGRLAGCIASNKDISYTGIDPCGETCVGNMRMASFYSGDWKFGYIGILGCAEDELKHLSDDVFDFALTSPPYFNRERYSDDPSQSYLKHNTYDKWIDGFLSPVIRESYRVLKSGCYLALNLKNYAKQPIADDALKIAEEMGFTLKKKYHMRLANLEYNLGKGSDKKWHGEPIFLLQK